ncbi:MAG: hypothetical protein WB798_03240, partial [Nocardioidaceae bacterium]
LAVLSNILALWDSAFDNLSVDDDPAEALTRAGRGAACIVIGHAHDRHDGQRSVGSRCRELAACPVMEVPETLRVPGQRRASVTPGASFAGGPR